MDCLVEMVKQTHADREQVCKGTWVRLELRGQDQTRKDPPAVTLKESDIHQWFDKITHGTAATV